jgi:hypothetical protein
MSSLCGSIGQNKAKRKASAGIWQNEAKRKKGPAGVWQNNAEPPAMLYKALAERSQHHVAALGIWQNEANAGVRFGRTKPN